MIGLLIQLLVLCLVFGVIYYIITLIPLPEPFGRIVLIILALIFLLVILGLLLPMAGLGVGWRGGRLVN